MNQFITLAAAEKVGALESASGTWQREVLETWAAEGRNAAEEEGYDSSADYVRALLSRAPDVEPLREDDRL